MAEFNIRDSHVGQINERGRNVIVMERKDRRRWWAPLLSAYGLLGTAGTLLAAVVAWYTAHRQFGWWFPFQ